MTTPYRQPAEREQEPPVPWSLDKRVATVLVASLPLVIVVTERIVSDWGTPEAVLWAAMLSALLGIAGGISWFVADKSGVK